MTTGTVKYVDICMCWPFLRWLFQLSRTLGKTKIDLSDKSLQTAGMNFCQVEVTTMQRRRLQLLCVLCVGFETAKEVLV